MKTIQGDIFKGEWDILIHCANLYHTMGAGVARIIKEKYPEAFDADLKTFYGDETKLGTFSYAQTKDKRIIVNLYAQKGIGNDGNPLNRNLQYDYLYDSLYSLCRKITRQTVIGVPYLIGCGLAGGSENIVLSILQDIENNFKLVTFHLFKYN